MPEDIFVKTHRSTGHKSFLFSVAKQIQTSFAFINKATKVIRKQKKVKDYH